MSPLVSFLVRFQKKKKAKRREKKDLTLKTENRYATKNNQKREGSWLVCSDVMEVERNVKAVVQQKE